MLENYKKKSSESKYSNINIFKVINHLWMSSLPSTISVFTISNGSNIVATDLKFRHVHRGYSPLQVTKFQSCSYNITNVRGGKNTNCAR